MNIGNVVATVVFEPVESTDNIVIEVEAPPVEVPQEELVRV